MVLNDDPDALSDDEYWSRWQRAADAQAAEGAPACGHAPPAELVAAVVADLDGDGLPG